MTRDLLVVGDDRLGRKLLARLQGNTRVLPVFDRSSSLKRVVKLLRRRVLSPGGVARMALAEYRRPDYPRPPLGEVRSNADLAELIAREKPARVYLFRAGLIIGRKVLGSGAEILNVHCARVPEYGGLGSIGRALRDGAVDQAASLHRVTEAIDRGEVLATRPYRLDPARSYAENENAAYDAGIELLVETLGAPGAAEAP